jgi:superfamily II DNA or RNA helicase
VRIERHNAWAYVHGAPAWFLEYLVRHLSVPVSPMATEGMRFGCLWTHEGQRYGSLVKGSMVPAGLAPHVEALAKHYGVPSEAVDARRRPEDQLPLWNVRAPWRPYQDAVHRQVCLHGTGVIDAPPRSGKTLMAARAIDVLNLPTVYVAPSVQIVKQSARVLRSFFGDDMVARLDGEVRPIDRDPEKQIVVATPNSVLNMPQEWWDRRGLLIVDEFHHAAADMYHRINMLAHNTYYRYGFTGTHFRTGDDRLAMEAVCSHVLFKIPVDYLVTNGWLAPPHVFFANVNPDRTCGGHDFRTAYQNGIVRHEKRNSLVVTIANTLAENGIPTIVLTRRRLHADLIGGEIPNSVVVKGGENALTSEAVKDFLAGRYQVLVGTQVIGEGVDVPAAAALVYACGGNDGVQMMQSYFRPLTAHEGKSVGRIYDFIDPQHSTLRRHSTKRLAMAREQFGSARVVAGR